MKIGGILPPHTAFPKSRAEQCQLNAKQRISPVILPGKYKIASAWKVVPTARAILKPLNFRAFNPQQSFNVSAPSVSKK
jgi:hypothetical protein